MTTLTAFIVCHCAYRPDAATQSNPSGAEYLYLCEESNIWVRSEWLATEYPTRERAEQSAARFPRLRPFVDGKFSD